jgi:hypothetical protein
VSPTHSGCSTVAAEGPEHGLRPFYQRRKTLLFAGLSLARSAGLEPATS